MLSSSISDTIAAISTPLGEGGIGVIRISGDQGIRIAEQIITNFPSEIEPRKVYHSKVTHEGNDIDDIIYYLMKAPNSYTGEDVIEIHSHGSPVILKRILQLCIQAGARQAEKGEFTRRAFLSGKIDLTQAEAILDLIKAKSEDSAISAARQLGGNLAIKIQEIRQTLVNLLASIEAVIDFPDEIEESDSAAFSVIESSINQINSLLATAEFGRIIRDGLATVIIGKPNVGKSSLLNALIKEDRAIVTDIPGTTRDTIEEYVNVQGMPLRIIDTAGIRQPKNKIEELGVGRTRAEIEKAELILVVIDGSDPLALEDKKILSDAGNDRVIIVVNKIDKGSKVSENELPNVPRVRVSALYGQGIDGLEDAIIKYAYRGRVSQESVVINLRHKQCLIRAKEALEKAQGTCRQNLATDFVAMDIKDAIQALGEVTGKVITEEILDNIFEKFCIGK